MVTSGVFCTNCGQMNDINAAFCSRCGAPQKPLGPAAPTVSATTAAAQQIYAPAAASFRGYGGFWLRFVAFIIDVIVISVVTWPLRLMLFFFGLRPHLPLGDVAVSPMVPFILGAALLLAFVRFFIGWLYWAGMESSSYQATLGKMALGLKVTGMAGNRISFARASGRYFGKILSSMTLLIGYIMAGFTVRKQALHDMLAGTLVIKK